MGHLIEFVGPNGAVQIFGIKLVGVTAANGRKLLFTIGFIAVALLFGWLVRRAANLLLPHRSERTRFWVRQASHVATAVLLVIGLCSIWFDDPRRLTTAAGLVTAGLAFALQKVVTAIAAYVVILRGKTFNVGDRIVMGGVRGDVVALGFIQTTIMEMGQPPGEQKDDPSMWVMARQYTGRIVTVSNDKIFDTPVYNYTRDFPYLWEEMHLPVSYDDDFGRAESILLEAARRHTTPIADLGEDALAELERRYFVSRSQLEPRVYWRITDNWMELTVRFIAGERGVRDLKDKMSRQIYGDLKSAGIGIASGTYQVIGMPPLQVSLQPPPPEGVLRP